MNREFIYINNKEVAVTDEKGQITVRDAEKNMRDVLVSEDKIEDLDNRIDFINDGIKIEKASISAIDKWYKVMGVISAGIVVGAPIALGFASGFGVIGIWAVACACACGYGIYSQRDSVKRINGYKKELKRAKLLKKDLTDDLALSREYNKEYQVPNAKIGEVEKINAVKDFAEQDAKLNRAFRVGFKNTPKVLVKTKNEGKK